MSKIFSLRRSRVWRTRTATALAAAGALVMSGGLVMITAPAASAHTETVSGNAVCNTETGKYDVTWTIQSAADYGKDWYIGSSSRPSAGVPLNVTQDDQVNFTGAESVAPGAGTLTLTVHAYWHKKGDANADKADSEKSGTVAIPSAPCDDDSKKVDYCHQEGNGSYTNNSGASIPGLINGHMGHAGDIWPAFDYQGTHYNAQGDQSILRNGCTIPPPPDECKDLAGIQPEGFPCSKQPETGKDPSQVQDCEAGTVTFYETPWTQEYHFVPNDNGGSWVLGDKVYGTKVEVGSREATLEECPRPDYPPCPGAEQPSLARLGGNTVASSETPGCYEQKSSARASCDKGHEVREWTEFRPWVWNEQLRKWELGDVTITADTGYVYDRPLTDDEFQRLQCQPGQPDPVVKPLTDERMTCEAGVEQRTGTQTTTYVWNAATRAYDPVVGPEVWGDWTYVRPLNDEEFQQLECQPGQPEPVVKPLSDERKSCDDGVEQRTGTQTTTYVWNAATRAYDPVVGAEVWGDWAVVRDLTKAEIEDLGCVLGSESSRPKPDKKPTVLGTEAVAPTAVDAGLPGSPAASSPTSLLAQLMVAGGLLLLLAGGWLGFGRREYGVHQA